MKFFINFLVCSLVCLVAVPILILLVFFLVPPRSLEVKYTDSDYSSFITKSNLLLVSMPLVDPTPFSIRYEGQTDIKAVFTSAEITAFLNQYRWIHYPLSQVQVKFNEDGRLEMSGVLAVSRFLTWLSMTEAVDRPQELLKKIPFDLNPSFYLKSSLVITDNRVFLSPEKLLIGRIPVPSSWWEKRLNLLNQIVEKRLTNVPGLMIISLSAGDDQLFFYATIPEKIYTFQ